MVPMKALGQAKSRLGRALSAEARAALSLKMFAHVLTAVAPVFGARRVLIVSRDPAVLAMARGLRLRTLRETRAGDLNAALAEGAAFAAARGAGGVVFMFGDLPLVTAEDVRALVAASCGGRRVVAAPDRADAGTNALFVAPPGAIRLRFGQDSFRRHRREVLARGLPWAACRRRGLAFDVDHPTDVEALNGGGAAVASQPPEPRAAAGQAGGAQVAGMQAGGAPAGGTQVAGAPVGRSVVGGSVVGGTLTARTAPGGTQVAGALVGGMQAGGTQVAGTAAGGAQVVGAPVGGPQAVAPQGAGARRVAG